MEGDSPQPRLNQTRRTMGDESQGPSDDDYVTPSVRVSETADARNVMSLSPCLERNASLEDSQAFTQMAESALVTRRTATGVHAGGQTITSNMKSSQRRSIQNARESNQAKEESKGEVSLKKKSRKKSAKKRNSSKSEPSSQKSSSKPQIKITNKVQEQEYEDTNMSQISDHIAKPEPQRNFMINVSRMSNLDSSATPIMKAHTLPQNVTSALMLPSNDTDKTNNQNGIEQTPLINDTANHGERSSNYTGSIFEDEDGDTSYDMNDVIDNVSHRSIGTTPAQEHIKNGAVNAPPGQDQADADTQAKALAAVEAAKPAASKVAEEEPMPLIKSGVSIAADLRFGWRPNEKELHGAPIPLHYDYEHFKVPINPATQKPFIVQYLGPRMQTSHDVHRKFANLETVTMDQCPDPRPGGKSKQNEPYATYQFKFPLRLPFVAKHEFDDPPPFVGMNPQLTESELERELIFDSNFESGNLDMVIKTQPMHYDLYMRVDTNTRGHHQWFYFSAVVPANMVGKTVTFRVVNFTKPMSLYTSGMRICYARKGTSYTWQKGGKNIKYGKSHFVRRPSFDPARVIYYSMLSFDFDFNKMKEGEKIYFAYCFPYTFTQLTHFLRSLNFVHKDSEIFKETVLCKSLSGVDVPLITITSRMKSDPKGYNQIKLSEFEDDDSKLSLPMYKKKKYIIVSSRVHPGESNSSYMMQGFLRYLLGDSHQAKQIRKRVVFKIIPMINVDGVIIGNYRTSMSGNDLNRRYVKPDFRIHPEVCAIKQLCNDLIYGPEEEAKKSDEPETLGEEIMAFVDMHGHSRKKNVFVYGPQEPLHSASYLKMRIIPKILSEETQKFRYHSCRFRLEQSKLKAARIVLWREFQIMNCFTFEASFHGHFDHMNNNQEFTVAQYEEMGEHLANSFFEYLMIIEEEERRRKLAEIAKKKKKKQRQQAMQRAAQIVREQSAADKANFSSAAKEATQQHATGNIFQGNSQKEVQSSGQNNYLNLPPSGKSVKKTSAVIGSSSSRARNVSHVTNKDTDKEHFPLTKQETGTGKKVKKQRTDTVDNLMKKEKAKKKNLMKSDTPSQVNLNSLNSRQITQVSSERQTRRTSAQPNNPNEPPLGSDMNVSAGSESEQARASSIQVGSQDLREIQRFANTQLTSYGEENIQNLVQGLGLVKKQTEPKQRRHGFRNLKDMFAAVRAQEKQRPINEESDARSEMSEGSAADNDPDKPEKATKEKDPNEDEDDDELSKEQQNKLHGDILNVIQQFVKVNNFKEHEYYGVSEHTLKKQKKIRQNQQQKAEQKAKEAANDGPARTKTEKLSKKEQSRKRHSQQKETLQAQNQNVNYQSKTLSVAQKRRSFNVADQTMIPSKQVITGDQLNQQVQHMAGNRLRGGLNSPLYYNLYQSTSNFSNFYIYRFDDRSNQFGNMQHPGIHANASQQHYLSLDGNQMLCEPLPNRSNKPQGTGFTNPNTQMQPNLSSNASQAYHSVQSKDQSKIYHLSKNADPTGHPILVTTNYGGLTAQSIAHQKPMQQQSQPTYQGSFGHRKSNTRETMQVDSTSSIYQQRDSQVTNGQQNGATAINEFTHQLEQMRHSQQPQAVQPMIFNFFNAKSDLKQRAANRNSRQPERNTMMSSTQQVNSTTQPRSTDPISQGRQSRIMGSMHAEQRKPPSIPARQGQSLIENNFSAANQGQIGALQQHPHQPGTMTSGAGGAQKPNPTINDRYPQTAQVGGGGTHINANNCNLIQRQKTLNNTQQTITASQAGANATEQRRQANRSGVSHKSRSSFQTRKQQQAQQQEHDDLQNQSFDLRNAKQLAAGAQPATMTQKQTSSKYGKIISAAESMMNQSQNDATSGNYAMGATTIPNVHYNTLPKKQHAIPQIPSQANKNQTRLALNSMHSTLAANLPGQNGYGGENFTQVPHTSQGQKSMLESSEIKRNAIRKIHPLNTFQGSASAHKKSLTATQEKERDLVADQPPLNRIQMHAASNAAILRDPRPNTLTKKNTSSLVTHARSRQIDAGPIDQIENLPTTGYIPQLPKTSAGKPITQNLGSRRSNNQDSAAKPSDYSMGKTTLIGNPAARDYPISGLDNGLRLNSEHQGAINYGQFKSSVPGTTMQSREMSSHSRPVIESRRQMSQFNESHDFDNTTSNGNNSSIGPVRKDANRMINDHSQLKRSGDYQTKMLKHMHIEANATHSSLLEMKPSSNEIGGVRADASTALNVSQDHSIAVSTSKSRVRSDKKQSFGQRVPPELYQKNPYQAVGALQQPMVMTQRINQQQAASRSELMSVARNAVDVNGSDLKGTNAASLAEIDGSFTLKEEFKSMRSPKKNISSYYPADGVNVWSQDVAQKQNATMVPNSHMVTQISNYKAHQRNADDHPQLIKSKTSVGDHQFMLQQQPPQGLGLQYTMSQGVNHVLAEPKYGIISSEQMATQQYQNNYTGQNVIGQRRLKSPREEAKFENRRGSRGGSRGGSRDQMLAMWMKAGAQQSQERISDQANSLHDHLNAQASTTQQAIANGAIIRVTKGKYQGLIKQRGNAITVDSPEQINNDVMIAASQGGGVTTERSSRHFDQGFASPQQQAQMQHMQLMATSHQIHTSQKREKSGGRRNRRNDALDSEDNRTAQTSPRVIIAIERELQQAQTHKKFSMGLKTANLAGQLDMQAKGTSANNSPTFKAKVSRNNATSTKRVSSISKKGQSLSVGSPIMSPKVSGAKTVEANIITAEPLSVYHQAAAQQAQYSHLTSNQPFQVTSKAGEASHMTEHNQLSKKLQQQADLVVRKHKVESRVGAIQTNQSLTKKQGAGVSRSRGRSAVKVSKNGMSTRAAHGEGDSSNI